jgi:uncharacterized membrane protein YkoI
MDIVCGHHLLLVLSVVAIVVMCISLTPSPIVAEAQTANQSSSGSKASSNGTSTTTAVKQPNASPISNITGSIPLRTTINEAISSKVKTSLSDAVTIAQKTVGTNTSATLAFIRPLNGYLVYDVHVRNNSNNTTTAVIVDAGDGKVLYKQSPPSLVFGGFASGFGHYGKFGKGKMEPFFGGGGGGMRRGGFADHGAMMMGQLPHMGATGSSSPRW